VTNTTATEQLTREMESQQRLDSLLIGDSLTNVISAIGQASSKVSATTYTMPTDDYTEAMAAYLSSPWFGKIVEIPADDAVREWRSWKATRQQIERLEAEESRIQLRSRVRQLMIESRVKGGAIAIMVGLPGSPQSPVDLSRMTRGSLRHIAVVGRDCLSCGPVVRDPMASGYGMPEYYTVSTDSGQQQVHHSRTVRLDGRRLLSAHGHQEWGTTVWTHLRDAVRSADLSSPIVHQLMLESKIDIVKIQDLIQYLGTEEGSELIQKRFMLANMMKSVGNALVLDKDDEWQQRQVSWAGIPDVVYMLLSFLSGAADIPVTRLVGLSARGLNATGEGDLRNYYDSVRCYQQITLDPAMSSLSECLIRSALGSRPDDIWYEWRPLYQMTRKEQAEVDKIESETVTNYVNTGLVPADALAEAAHVRMVESGSWPGLERALESSSSLADPPLEPPVSTVTGDPPGRSGVADAAPAPLYVRRQVLNAAEVLRWARSQGYTDTLSDDDLHVTVLYSRTPVDWMSIPESHSSRVEVTPGGPRVVERFSGGASVLRFRSYDLEWRHSHMVELGASHDFDSYQPHITISYSPDAPDPESVEPYRGRILLGPEVFESIDENWRERVGG